jgi:hypothetical protein
MSLAKISLVRSSSQPLPVLDSLGKEICDKHVAFEHSTLQHAKAIGDLLIQAKSEVKKQSQSWQSWLKVSCPALNARTARLYMQISSRYDELATRCHFESLSLKKAQEFLNAKKPKQQSSLILKYVANFQRASRQFKQDLDLFSNPNFDADTSKDLATLVQTLETLDRQIEDMLRKAIET